MKSFYLNDLVIDFLKNNIGQKFHAREIAEYIWDNEKDFCNTKMSRTTKKTKKDLIEQLIPEISALYKHGALKNVIRTNEPTNRRFYYENNQEAYIINETFPDEVSDNMEYIEGATQQVLINKYERNQKAKKECIEYYGSEYRCIICGFKFSERYGEKFKNKIHVHHIIPISKI